LKPPLLATSSDAAIDQLRSTEACRGRSATTHQRAIVAILIPTAFHCRSSFSNTHRGIHYSGTLGLVGRSLSVPLPYPHGLISSFPGGRNGRNHGVAEDLTQDRGTVNIFLLPICRSRLVMAWCLADQKFWPVAQAHRLIGKDGLSDAGGRRSTGTLLRTGDR
jgi:hypothetical protein